MSKDPLEKIVKCFIDESFPYRLSAEEIRNRAQVIEDEDRLDQIAFEMKRHHPIFDEKYISGVSMRNF